MKFLQLKNYKLRSKILTLPVGLVVVTFLIFGILITKEVIIQGHDEYIEGQKNLLQSSLSIITSTQSPADAFLGIEAGDHILAADMIEKLKQLGINNTYFLNNSMTFSYPEDAGVLKGLNAALVSTSVKKGNVQIFYDEPYLTGVAPIFDVETHVGFLVVRNKFPGELSKCIIESMNRDTTESADAEGLNVTEIINRNHGASLRKY